MSVAAGPGFVIGEAAFASRPLCGGARGPSSREGSKRDRRPAYGILAVRPRTCLTIRGWASAGEPRPQMGELLR
jgi:hypothetical protein